MWQHLTTRHADLLYSVKVAGRDAFIYILFEHKSKPDPLTPFQVLVASR